MQFDAETHQRIAQRLKDWDLQIEGEVLRTPHAAILFVSRGDEKFVLKCTPRNSEEEKGFTALASYQGEGAARVLAIEDGCGLLERAVPGTPLSDLVRADRDDEATAIWCDVAERLAGRSVLGGDPAKRNWPTVEDWGCGFRRYLSGSPHPALTRDLVNEADVLYRDLAASQRTRMLLHADLHHDNILFDEDRGWLAIDPKGLIGEFAYEAWAVLHNPLSEQSLYTDPAILDRRVGIICERVGFERRRVLDWCVAQSVLSALQHIEDGDDERCIRANAAVAEAAKRLIANRGANH